MSALPSPRSSSASGRSSRPIRRTCSRLSRAASARRSSTSRSTGPSVPAARSACDRQRRQGLPDLVVHLARDAQALLLLRGERPARAVAPLGLQPVQHLVERTGQRDQLGRVRVDRGDPAPGATGVDRPHHLGEVAQRGQRAAQQHEVDDQHHRQPRAQDQDLRQHDALAHLDGREDQRQHGGDEHQRAGGEELPEQRAARPANARGRGLIEGRATGEQLGGGHGGRRAGRTDGDGASAGTTRGGVTGG